MVKTLAGRKIQFESDNFDKVIVDREKERKNKTEYSKIINNPNQFSINNAQFQMLYKCLGAVENLDKYES